MIALNEFVKQWEEHLNQDPVLRRRIEHSHSGLEEGRALVEVDIRERKVFTIELKGKKFQLKPGKALKPLLSLSIPATLFKEMLLGKERVLYALLDKECTLVFDTPCFTHWDGITALAVILTAQEMVKNVPEVKNMVGEI